MKKVAVAVLAIALLTMLFAVPAMAAPKEKVSYVLHVKGAPSQLDAHQSPPWKLPGYLSPPPEGAAVAHWKDAPFIVGDVLELTIDGVTIPKDFLEYKGFLSYSINTVNWASFDVPLIGKDDETIEIYTGHRTHPSQSLGDH